MQPETPSEYVTTKNISAEDFLNWAFQGFNRNISTEDAIRGTGIILLEEVLQYCKQRTYDVYQKKRREIDLYSLSYDDTLAIMFYTFGYTSMELREELPKDVHENPYSLMNKALRECSDDFFRFRGVFYKIVVALHKLPRYHTPCLYRGMDRTFSYHVNDIITWNQFSSMTINEDVAKDFSQNGTIFVIKGFVWGYDIHTFSIFESEQEILMEPFTSFIVSNIEKSDTTKIFIEVKESFSLGRYFGIQNSDPNINNFSSFLPRDVTGIQTCLLTLDGYIYKEDYENAQLCWVALVTSVSSLRYSDHVISGMILNENGLNTAINGLEKFNNDPDTCRNFIELLTLIAVKHGNIEFILRDEKVIPLVLETTRKFIDYPALCECTCRFIDNLIIKTGSRDAVAARGAMEIVVTTLEKYGSFTDVTNTVFGVLNKYACNNENLNLDLAHKIVDVTFTNEDGHLDEPKVLVKVFELLNTLGNNRDMANYIVNKGYLDLCIDSLQSCNGNTSSELSKRISRLNNTKENLATNVFSSLATITSKAAASCSRYFIEAINKNIISEMIEIINKYTNNKIISRLFVTSLDKLSLIAEQETLNKVAYNQNGVEYLLKILELYADHPNIAMSGLSLLEKLVKRYPPLVDRIVNKNGGLTVVSVLRCHIENKEHPISKLAKELLLEFAKNGKYKILFRIFIVLFNYT